VKALTFVVECYSPAVSREAVQAAGARARTATAELGAEYLGALLVPGDEVVFHLFAAGSAEVVREASTRAGVDFERVLESVPIGIEGLDGATR
jgi:hypothetical protein